MAIFLDPPLWPAHGRMFAHLISDTSLEELHDFARRAGLNGRAFDRDHYDVPDQRCDELVRLGARRVDGGTLVRILMASGLRVRAKERSGALLRPLRQRWLEVLAGHAGLGEELLRRWGEDHRRYHDRAHLLSVLESLDTLDKHQPDRTPGRLSRAVRLAAWFHDAVYLGQPGEDEEASAALAESRLTAAGLPDQEVAEVVRLVRLTGGHAPAPGDAPGAMLCDADLSVLARPGPAYRRYVEAVREEYGHVGDADFTRGRAAVVRQLFNLDPLFNTAAGRDLWQDAARENLHAELARLEQEVSGTP
ncbi:DUF4031 domain-containing protein [Arthrobacter castelli]|uniref:DUF4031 domain-containing protein n=1 Tax=Arthrobacter castelli TaxID=271431 RepID=UPI0003F7CA80|nr:DUF4031 domain-containing protein [Arthrobacter castelli]